MNPAVKYCAIYTRKSTDEGLDKDFNSLDAQREACLAYIVSQKMEGWVSVGASYDDGGFSGGNIQRPGLQKLLEEIKAGKINIVVVYKIDRLTRSLIEFAKLVEVFDRHQVTFVSVTQSFNTTTSMGRLTLNVLLSFAQFEREVTADRIRDKIAASKKKGLWMGGTVSLGYDAKNRSLVINANEAALVRKIFQEYLNLGSVIKLKSLLDGAGYKTKGGRSFTRGMLYWILQNPLYIGKLRHKEQLYDGAHFSIIEQELWTAVQKKIAEHPVPRGRKNTPQKFLLQGILYNEADALYSPTFTTKKGKRYLYYVSVDKIQNRELAESISLRIPAQEIENFVENSLSRHLSDTKTLSHILGISHGPNYEQLKRLASKSSALMIHKIIKKAVQRITVHKNTLNIIIKPTELSVLFQEELRIYIQNRSFKATYEIVEPFHVTRSWKGSNVIRLPAQKTPEDIFSLPPYELKNLVRGIIWRDEHFKGMTIRQIAEREKSTDAFVGRLIRDTFSIA